jgi:hypothetical protein
MGPAPGDPGGVWDGLPRCPLFPPHGPPCVGASEAAAWRSVDPLACTPVMRCSCVGLCGVLLLLGVGRVTGEDRQPTISLAYLTLCSVCSPPHSTPHHPRSAAGEENSAIRRLPRVRCAVYLPSYSCVRAGVGRAGAGPGWRAVWWVWRGVFPENCQPHQRPPPTHAAPPTLHSPPSPSPSHAPLTLKPYVSICAACIRPPVCLPAACLRPASPQEWDMVTKKGGIPGVEFALAKTATGENNYLEWHLTVTGPVSAFECSIGVLWSVAPHACVRVCGSAVLIDKALPVVRPRPCQHFCRALVAWPPHTPRHAILEHTTPIHPLPQSRTPAGDVLCGRRRATMPLRGRQVPRRYEVPSHLPLQAA